MRGSTELLRFSSTRWGIAAIILAMTLAGQLAFLLMGRNAEESLADLKPLEVGDVLRTLDVLTPLGGPVSVSPAVLPPCGSLIFFTPTCEYCILSAPQWSRDFGPSGLQAVGIGFTTPDSAQAFAEKHGLRFPVYGQPGTGAELTRQSRVLAVPRVAQVDKSGRVLNLIRGGPYIAEDLQPFQSCGDTIEEL